jgi:hypothetical protein
MSKQQWYYYSAGPFAGVYEVYAALGMSEQEPDLIGRTVKPDAMIAAAECGDWDAVEALQFRDAAPTEPEPHAEWLQQRFSDGAKTIKGDE